MMGMVKESTGVLETVCSKDFSYLRVGTRCRKGLGKYYSGTLEQLRASMKEINK